MDKRNTLGFFAILFFGLYIILPNYFALEISSSFPLLTASRIILILLIFSYVIQRKGIINIKIFENKKIGRSVKIFFLLILVCDLYYIRVTTEAIKDIFTLILEEFMVIWIISKIIDTKEKLLKAMEILVIFSGIVAVVAIFGSITGVNLFHYLNSVSRSMLMVNYKRLGYIRADAGFGHPVYYGAYNAIMMPVAMYLIEYSKKSTKYVICLLLDLLALFFSNSRGSILVVVVVLLYMIIKKNRKQLKKYFKFIVIGMIGVIIIIFIKPDVIKLFSNIYISIMNVFSEDTVSLDNYGGNINGVDSRTMQFSEIVWTAKNNLIFGMGVSAQNRGAIKYLNSSGTWIETKTFDVGYIAMFCNYGLIGIIGYLSLFISIISIIYGKKYIKEDGLLQMFKFVFISYFLCLFSVSGIDSVFWIMFALLVSYVNLIEKQKFEKKGDEG